MWLDVWSNKQRVEAAKCCTTCTEFPNTVGKSSAVFTEEQGEARVTCNSKQEPALSLGHSSGALLYPLFCAASAAGHKKSLEDTKEKIPGVWGFSLLPFWVQKGILKSSSAFKQVASSQAVFNGIATKFTPVV